MKETLHWQIYICCRLSNVLYYSFIRRFKNFVIVLSAQTDPQCHLSYFIFFGLAFWKIHSSFASPDLPVIKLISLLLAQLGQLENPPSICQLDRWKNHPAFAGTALPTGRAGYRSWIGPWPS